MLFVFAVTNAPALLGTSAVVARVEARVERGLPRFTIVGMNESDSRDARERIRCGLASLGIELGLHRITVSIAPADLPKGGAGFDLPILIAVLAALEEIPVEAVERIGSYGELGLDGSIRAVYGTLAGAHVAARAEWSELLVASSAAGVAAHGDVPVVPVATTESMRAHLVATHRLPATTPATRAHVERLLHDLADVRGQANVVRAVEVAAAGGHNLLMYGPPGCGKSMLAQRLPSILPHLSHRESLEVATIHDAAGQLDVLPSAIRPFRAPHHTVSQQALIGGGAARPIVGEISLAHRGVLFLDELPEFRPTALDALRQPLEQGIVAVRRSKWAAVFPASVQLVAAMNLCRCGRFGTDTGQPCTCQPHVRDKYQQRVSGAIFDRFDLRIRVGRPPGTLARLAPADSSSTVRDRVEEARERQRVRWGDATPNARVTSARLDAFQLEDAAAERLEAVVAQFGVGGRWQSAVVRTSRTIADLRGSDTISSGDIAAALPMSMPVSGGTFAA